MRTWSSRVSLNGLETLSLSATALTLYLGTFIAVLGGGT
jgi:hypothetical protein